MSASPPSAVVIGASGGIGRALVAGLVGRGTYGSVFALSRSGTVEAGPVAVGPIDLTDEASVRIAAERVGRHGPVGLVVVAAGLLHGSGVAPEKAIRTLDPAAMAAVFAVNAIGPALAAKHFLPLMPRAGRSVFAALSARALRRRSVPTCCETCGAAATFPTPKAGSTRHGRRWRGWSPTASRAVQPNCVTRYLNSTVG